MSIKYLLASSPSPLRRNETHDHGFPGIKIGLDKIVRLAATLWFQINQSIHDESTVNIVQLIQDNIDRIMK